jgi:energy-converting hydrogenase Eha subunit C
LSLALLLLLHVRKGGGFFWVQCFLVLKCISEPVLYALLKYKPFGHTITQKYAAYFYPYWAFYAFEAIICFMIIRELFLKSLEPLEGLRRLGLLLFGWITVIAAVVALAVAIGPATSGIKYIVLAVSEFQRCQSLLQLCLLVFVFSVARPLGVTSRHPVFGTTLGFSVLAISDLLTSGWLHSSDSMVSSLNLFHAAALPIALCIWLAYAFMPEPKRVPVALPVTSALLRWNEVAKSLGKTGGHVVVVGNREIIDHDMAAWNRALDVVEAKRSA